MLLLLRAFTFQTLDLYLSVLRSFCGYWAAAPKPNEKSRTCTTVCLRETRATGTIQLSPMLIITVRRCRVYIRSPSFASSSFPLLLRFRDVTGDCAIQRTVYISFHQYFSICATSLPSFAASSFFADRRWTETFFYICHFNFLCRYLEHLSMRLRRIPARLYTQL